MPRRHGAVGYKVWAGMHSSLRLSSLTREETGDTHATLAVTPGAQYLVQRTHVWFSLSLLSLSLPRSGVTRLMHSSSVSLIVRYTRLCVCGCCFAA